MDYGIMDALCCSWLDVVTFVSNNNNNCSNNDHHHQPPVRAVGLFSLSHYIGAAAGSTCVPDAFSNVWDLLAV